MEIERKFLVRKLPVWKAPKQDLITQSYLAVGETEVRIRNTNDQIWTLTVKRGAGLERAEIEVGISPTQYHVLLKDALYTLKKHRTKVKVGAYIAEVDQFLGPLSPLVLVEVEFKTRDQSLGFNRPSWFGTEVTQDARFANQNLAQLDSLDSIKHFLMH